MRIVIAVGLTLFSTVAWAQTAPACPTLPADAGLTWEQRVDATFITCKALTDDGRQVFNLMLTARDPKISLERRLRQEESTFSGEEMYWYQPNLGGQETLPQMASRRIAVVEYEDDRYAQVWINAASPEELASLISLARKLDMNNIGAQLSAGN